MPEAPAPAAKTGAINSKSAAREAQAAAAGPRTVGQLLRETLEAQCATQADLSRATGLSTKHVNQLLQDQIDLSADCAVRIGHALGIPGSVWLALQGVRQQWEADQIDPGPRPLIESTLRRQRDEARAAADRYRRELDRLRRQLRTLAPETPLPDPTPQEQQR